MPSSNSHGTFVIDFRIGLPRCFGLTRIQLFLAAVRGAGGSVDADTFDVVAPEVLEPTFNAFVESVVRVGIALDGDGIDIFANMLLSLKSKSLSLVVFAFFVSLGTNCDVEVCVEELAPDIVIGTSKLAKISSSESLILATKQFYKFCLISDVCVSFFNLDFTFVFRTQFKTDDNIIAGILAVKFLHLRFVT